MIESILHSLYRTFIEKDRYMAFVKGLGVTLQISVFAVMLGIAIGVIVAVVKFSAKRSKWMRPLELLCNAYVGIIRGTPVYVQLLIMNGIILSNLKSSMTIAILTFGINSGAYVAEIIRAGINSVDKGQMEAGRLPGSGLRDHYEEHHPAAGGQKYSACFGQRVYCPYQRDLHHAAFWPSATLPRPRSECRASLTRCTLLCCPSLSSTLPSLWA